jgi:ferritin-like metal-binding protein YciE
MAKTANQLFEHHLREMYDAEQKMVRALRTMARKATNRKLSAGFTRHAKTTERQVKRLERVFKAVGRKPRRQTCAGMDGLIEEYSTFAREEKPEKSVLDAFSAEAGLKAEHYEIVAYKGLIDLAKQLGLKNEASLLKETLQEEEATSRELEQMSKLLGKSMPMDDDAGDGQTSWSSGFSLSGKA